MGRWVGATGMEGWMDDRRKGRRRERERMFGGLGCGGWEEEEEGVKV